MVDRETASGYTKTVIKDALSIKKMLKLKISKWESKTKFWANRISFYQPVTVAILTTLTCFFINTFILPVYARPKPLPKHKYSSFDNIAVSWCHSTITGLGAWLDLAFTIVFTKKV